MSRAPPSKATASTAASTTDSASSSPDQTIKNRILTHMNADHRDSLSLYLQHYNKIPPLYCQPQDSRLVDINPSYLLLESKWGRSIINFHPPMTSLSESRDRVVKMHQDCLSGLGLSKIKVTEFRGFWTGVPDFVFLTFVMWTFISLSFRSSLLPPAESSGPGSSTSTKYLSHFGWVVWSLNGTVPFLPWLAYTLATPTLVFMFTMHSLEPVYFARTRLRKHQIPSFSGLWWKWMLSCAGEGFMAFRRFDGLVRRKEREMETKKH